MDWPSKNVSPGGIFQPAKVNYSPETRDFLKTLIEETKMSTMQRNKINYSLRSGDPLPPISSFQDKSTKKSASIIIRPGSSKKRSQTTIMEMGAYEREKFNPIHPTVDREKAKKELADRMAFGKIIHPKLPVKDTKKDSGKKNIKEKKLTRFDEIKLEIQDREDWLKNMEQLGEGDKHRAVIALQIEEKIRELERLAITENQ